jgi:hypothetical protein
MEIETTRQDLLRKKIQENERKKDKASLHNVDATGLNLVKASNNANTLSGNLLWRGTDNVSAFLAPSIRRPQVKTTV